MPCARTAQMERNVTMSEPIDYNTKASGEARPRAVAPQPRPHSSLKCLACVAASVVSLTIAQAMMVVDTGISPTLFRGCEVKSLTLDSGKNLYILTESPRRFGGIATIYKYSPSGAVTPLVTGSNLRYLLTDQSDNLYTYSCSTKILYLIKAAVLSQLADLSAYSNVVAMWTDAQGFNFVNRPNTNDSEIVSVPYATLQANVLATLSGFSLRGATRAQGLNSSAFVWDCNYLYSFNGVSLKQIIAAADIRSAAAIPLYVNEMPFGYKVTYNSWAGIGAVNFFATNTPPSPNLNTFLGSPTSSPNIDTMQNRPGAPGTSFLTPRSLGSWDRLGEIYYDHAPNQSSGFGAAYADLPDPFSGVAYLLPFQFLATPTYLTSYAGLNASLKVSVFSDDDSPLFYQWSQNGVPIPGATNATLTITNVQPADAGVYLARVSLAPGDTNADTVVTDGGLSVLPPYTFLGVTNGFYGGAAAGSNAGLPGVFLAETAFGVIEFLDTNGLATVIAGTLGGYGLSDGISSNAMFATPQGLAIDAQNNLFVADTGNNAIREISQTGNVWTTATIAGGQTNAAGARIAGWADGLGTNALFSHPFCVTVDGLGNVYAGDNDSNVVRKLTWTGSNWMVTTLAGIPGRAGWADGAATNAMFNGIFGLAADALGNVFVADRFNYVVREIDTNGTVTTIAGLRGNSGNIDGVGSNARFGSPDAISLRCDGTLIVGDAGYGTVRQLIPEGTNWLAATLSSGVFVQPRAVATDCSGLIYVSDAGLSAKGSNSVLFGYPGPPPPSITAQPQPQTQLAGAAATLSVTVSNASPVTYQWLFNGMALTGQTDSTLTLSGLGRTNEGVYQVVVTGTNGAVISSSTLLRVLVPPLLEPPFIRGTNGTVHLLFADSDGGLPDDLDTVEVQWRSTLPGGTDTDWQTLSNYPTLFNGFISVDDTNGLGSFKIYRVMKH